MDLTFVIDVSGSIRREHFDDVKEFICDIVNELEVSLDKTRVGAISFSDTAEIEFTFNMFVTKQDVMARIKVFIHKYTHSLRYHREE